MRKDHGDSGCFVVVADAEQEPNPTPEVFWRPGCPFCRELRRDLGRRGIEARWLNIWSDGEARGFVREVNGGNETVPTVRVGAVVLTNPSGAEVAALLPDPPPGEPPDRLMTTRRRWWPWARR